MLITGTFIDEISHDIPHQNWGAKEWEQDFVHMKNMGIDTVVMIRCGYRKFITYPSPYLIAQGCFTPPVDLTELFLTLADRYGMNFYFGLYDSGQYWDTGDMNHEIDPNRFVIDEVWKHYGHHPSFKGWYLSMEISRRTRGYAKAFQVLGHQCKQISEELPVLISPWIDGKKAVMASSGIITKEHAITLREHEQEWEEIFDAIKGSVDIVAFQDGHVDIEALSDFLVLNKQLADKHGLQSWTNTESFDRDMPIKFLPVKFEKLKLKLEAAAKAGLSKAISFEFSHFMSPQSMYPSAHHLYNRYMEYKNKQV
jgi:Domain of unknown function (DUF4434)/Domain of unknown function (DUF5109)